MDRREELNKEKLRLRLSQLKQMASKERIKSPETHTRSYTISPTHIHTHSLGHTHTRIHNHKQSFAHSLTISLTH